MKVSLDFSCGIPRSVTLAVCARLSRRMCSMIRKTPVLECEVCFDVSKRNFIKFNRLEKLNLFLCIISHGFSSWMIRLKRENPCGDAGVTEVM